MSVESHPREMRASAAEQLPASGRPLIVRLLFPSVTDLIFIGILLVFSFTALSTKLLGDAGIGWHIRNGQQILATHSIPHVDSFSSTMSGQPWYAWEWGYDVLIAAIHHVTGLNGVVFFSAVIIAAAFAATFRLALIRGTSLPLAVVLVLLAASASTIHFFARPHLFTWIFAIIWFQLLDSAELSPDRVRRLYWLPVITLAWVNLHGGFVLGFALLGIYLVAGAIRYWTELRAAHRVSKDSAQHALPSSPAQLATWLKTVGIITFLCAVATFINPYGYELHVHIYRYLTDRFLMNHIDEFQSPNFHAVAQQCFAALLLITLVAVASAPSKLRLSHLFVVLFAIYTGLYASRNLPASSILLVLVIGPMLASAARAATSNDKMLAWLQRWFSRLDSFHKRMGAMERSLSGHLWPAAVVILGIAVSLQQGRLGSTQVMNAHFDATRFPVGAVDYLAQNQGHEPVFSPDFWGGYLIYRLYPQIKVVVDDRHDFYGDEFLKHYLKVVHVDPEWAKELDGFHADWVLVPTESPLSNILKIDGDWRLVYEGKTGVLFQRKGSGR